MFWKPYVPVAQRKAQAAKAMEKLRKKGHKIEPVQLSGRNISSKWWGIKWCDHLEAFADYESRLPRGRTYVRNGSICHLSIEEGKCEAIVSGSSLYNVSIYINKLMEHTWNKIKQRCMGQVGSIIELLQGKISDQVMQVVADQKEGLFPSPKEINYQCSCPDWASMCKHVAAVLYGIGSRLDDAPELLFKLRGVNAQELVATSLNLEAQSPSEQLQEQSLEELFGIDLDSSHMAAPSQSSPKRAAPKTKQKKALNNPPSFDVSSMTGKEMTALRNQLKMTVSEFADELGVAPASVYRWEKCANHINCRSDTKEILQQVIHKLN